MTCPTYLGPLVDYLGCGVSAAYDQSDAWTICSTIFYKDTDIISDKYEKFIHRIHLEAIHLQRLGPRTTAYCVNLLIDMKN